MPPNGETVIKSGGNNYKGFASWSEQERNWECTVPDVATCVGRATFFTTASSTFTWTITDLDLLSYQITLLGGLDKLPANTQSFTASSETTTSLITLPIPSSTTSLSLQSTEPSQNIVNVLPLPNNATSLVLLPTGPSKGLGFTIKPSLGRSLFMALVMILTGI